MKCFWSKLLSVYVPSSTFVWIWIILLFKTFQSVNNVSKVVIWRSINSVKLFTWSSTNVIWVASASVCDNFWISGNNSFCFCWMRRAASLVWLSAAFTISLLKVPIETKSIVFVCAVWFVIVNTCLPILIEPLMISWGLFKIVVSSAWISPWILLISSLNFTISPLDPCSVFIASSALIDKLLLSLSNTVLNRFNSNKSCSILSWMLCTCNCNFPYALIKSAFACWSSFTFPASS